MHKTLFLVLALTLALFSINDVFAGTPYLAFPVELPSSVLPNYFTDLHLSWLKSMNATIVYVSEI
jgi:hypothetical protein